MATNKGAAKSTVGKGGGAVNATTGNFIARDASSGRYAIVEPTNLKITVPTKGGKMVAASKKKGSFTINKRKAERAEQVVVSYLNKSEK